MFDEQNSKKSDTKLTGRGQMKLPEAVMYVNRQAQVAGGQLHRAGKPGSRAQQAGRRVTPGIRLKAPGTMAIRYYLPVSLPAAARQTVWQ